MIRGFLTVILERSDRIPNMKQNQYYTYILTNARNTVLYIGVTNDLTSRVYQHKNKVIKGFTEKYNLSKLVYYEIFDDALNAIGREKSLKNLVRRKKDRLINTVNPKWDDLYEKILST